MKNYNFSLFFKANLFVTVILFLLFLQYNETYTLSTFIITFMGALSSATILYMVYYLVFFIFIYTNKFVLYFSALIFYLTNLGLIVDFFIFRLYKFHINAMVLNILTSPSAMDSIQLGIAPILLLLLVIVGFALLEIYLIKKLIALNEEKKIFINKRLNKMIIFPVILIVIGEKFIYGFASLYTENEILSKFKVIPLYQPLTFNRIAAKYFDYKPEVEVKNTIKTQSSLNYPSKELILSGESKKVNIFIFASDAVRADMITEDIAPNIAKFKHESISFSNHYSGGNATRFGIFSLMYGINSTYWFSFLQANKGSVLFDVLNKLHYDVTIISSTNTNWPEFRKTCYINVQEGIKDDFEGSPWEKDLQSKDYFVNMIEKYDGEKPLFSFVFLDSPHGYSYPKEFNKFNASDENINYLTVTKDGKDIKSLYARYENSVYYNDNLFGQMIQKLKDKNLYDNSIIIFTSDHGQEFYEYGYFGHNSAFSKAQVNSPLIIKLPIQMKEEMNITQGEYGYMTSHIDVVPTLLNILGVKNPSSDYSNGKNIFSKEYKRDNVFIANWNHNAIVTDKFTYIFSNLPNKMFKNEVRENDSYKKVAKEKVDGKIVLEIMNENRAFLK